MRNGDSSDGHGGSGRGVPGIVGGLVCVPPALAALAFATLLPEVSDGRRIHYGVDWIPSLGIGLSFLVDGLSLTFALLITVIGAFIALYSSKYMAGHHQLARFYVFMAAFTLSMLGLVLADNLITLFVFWELTTVTSYLLVGFDHASPKARRNALQALLVTGTGGLVLLAGIILIAQAAGTYELSAILAEPDVLRDHELYLPILVLVLVGAFTKSAQFPFHFWLPNAMAAPTPVSAFLHSATMVKAGIYLMARLHPALGGTDVWVWTLTIFGAVTAVLASVIALRQTDLKLALAYTTVMALGTLTMFLGSEATIAVAAALTFLIVHSLYKATLFLVVGIIDHETGTRDVDALRGLARAMPITAVIAAGAAFSMAGFPPFLGFIGKELKYEGALAIASEPALVASAAVLANALMVAVAGIVALRPFSGAPAETPRKPHDPSIRMWIGPLVLAILGLAFGVAPWLIGQTMVQPAVTAVLGRPETIKLSLWHGVNLPLMLSLLTFGLGVAFYLGHRRIRPLLGALEDRLPVSFDTLWDKLIDGLKSVAGLQTRVLQHGAMRGYLFVVFATIAVLGGGTVILKDQVVLPAAFPDLLVKDWAIVALILGGTFMTVLTRSKLAAIAALGAVGVGVALVFLLFAAPDVAITQLFVETLIVVLLAVVMLRLPEHDPRTVLSERILRASVATCVGLVSAVVMLGVVDGPIDRTLTTFFETASVPQAYGQNIVNVILVDFRALDTFGEIAVVAVAAIAAYGLIRGKPRKEAE